MTISLLALSNACCGWMLPVHYKNFEGVPSAAGRGAFKELCVRTKPFYDPSINPRANERLSDTQRLQAILA
jgi:hypothetical protein